MRTVWLAAHRPLCAERMAARHPQATAASNRSRCALRPPCGLFATPAKACLSLGKTLEAGARSCYWGLHEPSRWRRRRDRAPASGPARLPHACRARAIKPGTGTRYKHWAPTGDVTRAHARMHAARGRRWVRWPPVVRMLQAARAATPHAQWRNAPRAKQAAAQTPNGGQRTYNGVHARAAAAGAAQPAQPNPPARAAGAKTRPKGGAEKTPAARGAPLGPQDPSGARATAPREPGLSGRRPDGCTAAASWQPAPPQARPARRAGTAAPRPPRRHGRPARRAAPRRALRLGRARPGRPAAARRPPPPPARRPGGPGRAVTRCWPRASRSRAPRRRRAAPRCRGPGRRPPCPILGTGRSSS
jgi:hypothetical protein